MSEDVRLNAYFERIGFAGSIAPTLATLEALHALQPAGIPFENLDSLLGLPVPLDQASLNQKLLVERRGGYCFEQNLMLLRVLVELGFEARGHLAKVLWGHPDGEDVTPGHMLLTVDIAGTSYLADVGFGGLMLTVPLKLRTEIEQETPLETYRLTGDDPALRLEVRRDVDKWWPAYEFSLAPIEDAAYVAINDALNADADWFLRRHLLVERVEAGVRRTLFDTRLTITTREGRQTQTIADLALFRETLLGPLGIALPPGDTLDAVLTDIIAKGASED